MSERQLEVTDPFIAELSPEVRTLYDELKQCEDLLNVGELTHDDIQELIVALEERWPYMEQPIQITGNVFRVLPPEDIQPGAELSLGKEYVEDRIVQSKGFWAYSTPIVQDGEHVTDHWRVGHFFYLGSQEVAQNMFLTHSYNYHGCAGLDELIVKLPEAIKSQGDDGQEYRPEILSEIDSRVLNAEDEIEAIKSLAGFELDAAHDDTLDYYQSVVDYVGGLIKFDDGLPYSFAVDDYFLLPETNGDIHIAQCREEVSLVGYASQLQLIEKRQEFEQGLARHDNRFVWGMEAYLIQDAPDVPLKRVIIPVDNIIDVDSVRRQLRRESDM